MRRTRHTNQRSLLLTSCFPTIFPSCTKLRLNPGPARPLLALQHTHHPCTSPQLPIVTSKHHRKTWNQHPLRAMLTSAMIRGTCTTSLHCRFLSQRAHIQSLIPHRVVKRTRIAMGDPGYAFCSAHYWVILSRCRCMVHYEAQHSHEAKVPLPYSSSQHARMPATSHCIRGREQHSVLKPTAALTSIQPRLRLHSIPRSSAAHLKPLARAPDGCSIVA